MLPQFIVLIWISMGIGIALAKDGQPMGEYSFWQSLISLSFFAAVLYWGGFFGG